AKAVYPNAQAETGQGVQARGQRSDSLYPQFHFIHSHLPHPGFGLPAVAPSTPPADEGFLGRVLLLEPTHVPQRQRQSLPGRTSLRPETVLRLRPPVQHSTIARTN